MKKIFYYLVPFLFAVPAEARLVPLFDPQCNYEYYTNRIAGDGNWLWIASNRGLIHYEKSTGKSVLIKNTDIGLEDDTFIFSVKNDRAGNLWIGTKLDEVYMYDGISATQYTSIEYATYPHLYIMYCYAMAFNSANNPWSAGFYLFADYNVKRKHTFPAACSDGDAGAYSEYIVTDMEFDSGDNLWMTMDRGRCFRLVCSKKGERGTDIVLRGTAATSLAIDSSDNIWFLSSDGLHCYNQFTETDTRYSSDNHSEIPDGLYTACKIDEQGNIWSISSQALLKYDGDKFTAYSCDGFDQARALFCDGSVVWIYTSRDELLRFEDGVFTRHPLNTEPSGIASTTYDKGGFSVISGGRGELRISGPADITSVDVYTVSGSLIVSAVFGGCRSVTVHSLALSNRGIYILKVRHAGGEAVVKTDVR